MATYLVTGGCGFIGSHICDRLISDGHAVVVLDDLSTGSDKNLNSEAIFYLGSVTDKEMVAKIFADHQFDGIIHEASHINTSVPAEDPRRDLSINVEGTLNLMDAALERKSGKFVFASSVAIYGSPSKIPVLESGPIKPIYSYGIAKQCAEEYIGYYGAMRGLDYHIARYGNVYGPRQPIYGEVGVIAIFTQKLLKGTPLTVFGDGQHLRDFLYIHDAVDATVGLLDLPGSETFNLASGKATSVNEVVKAFEATSARPLEILSAPERANELGKFYADISKLCAALNWRPKTDLNSGIEATLEFYRDQA
jgi:UDP-glucose 4-epimerase